MLSALAFRTADKLTSTLIIPDKLSQKPHPIIILFIIMHHYYLNFDWLPILPGTTCRVEPVLSGHPWGMAE